MRSYLCFIFLFICNFLSAQNVGIGTPNPKARLHVADSSVLFTTNSWVLPSNPGNPPAQGSGRRMMWYADKGAFRTGGTANNAWDKDSIGDYSFASGLDSKAKGMYSTAMGVNNNALNWYNFVAGIGNTTYGVGSAAIGYNNIVKGQHSMALGNHLQTGTHDNAMIIGSYNDTSTYFNGVFLPQYDYRIFQLGNGSAFGRSNAITVLNSGNTGIGALFPLARLHVDSSVLFTGKYPLPASPSNPPVSFQGTRMMWYADKAAFRVGAVSGSNWEKNNIGYYSIAAGYDAMAKGENGVAFGNMSAAIGENTVALGNFSEATGNRAVALGYVSKAEGYATFSAGFAPIARGHYSVSIGANSLSEGDGSYSFGDNAISRATSSFSIGNGTIAKNNNVITLGNYNDSTGSNKIFEIGNGAANNERRNALTILQNGNTGIGTIFPATRLDVAGLNNWDLTNSEGDFRIGNNQYRIKMGVALGGGGAGSSTIRAVGGVNVLALGAGTQNLITLNGGTGFVGIGLDNPTQKLHVAGNILATGTITPSDIRYKKNIQPIDAAIQKVEQLNGVTYQYRSDEFTGIGFDSSTQVGLIAQDVEKIFPQLVFTDEKGYKSVDYSKLIALLVEGMKAQQKEIDALKSALDKLKNK